MATLTANSAPPAFTGEFRHRVEGKNRITIPAAWRFEEEVELFMISRELQKCIGVYTREVVEKKRDAATEHMTPENRARFVDIFGRKLRQVTLDKAGRVSIPDELCREYHIKGEVWLSGAWDAFNIWNTDDFDAQKASVKASEADFMRQAGI